MTDATPVKKLHNIATCRRRENVSMRKASAHFKLPHSRIAVLEDEYYDLRLSDVYKWQQVLKVPILELLVDTDEELAVRDRAKLVTIMKTVQSILEENLDPVIKCHALNLRKELVGLMPELDDVNAWPLKGSGVPPINTRLANPISTAILHEQLPLHEE